MEDSCRSIETDLNVKRKVSFSSRRAVVRQLERLHRRMKHIVFLSHHDLNLYRFRRPIMLEAKRNGWKVTALVPDGEYAKRFEYDGITHVAYQVNRGGINVIQETKTFFEIVRLVRKVKPDIVHTFTTKPNIYGTIASRLARVPVVINSITGLGSVFADPEQMGAARIAILAMYRIIGRISDRVIFQNNDDLNYFTNKGVVEKKKTELIRGSGVDLRRFSKARYPPYIGQQCRAKLGIPANSIVVTLGARIIWDKGIREFIDAGKSLRDRSKEKVTFVLVGDYDDSNPRVVPKDYVDKAVKDGSIIFAGWRDDMPAILSMTDIAVLPSVYREGVPSFLIEALAMGLPIITTDSAGCRDTVKNEWNGLLIPGQDSVALAGAVRSLVEDESLRKKMGERSRRKAEQEYDVEDVIRRHMAIYKGFLSRC